MSQIKQRQLHDLWKLMMALFIICWGGVANAVTVKEFLLLDNTLVLNADLLADRNAFSVRRDFGREQIRALGLRREFGREMIRMGREFHLYLRALKVRRTYGARFVRDAGARELRRGVRDYLIRTAVKKRVNIRSGRYLLGVRRLDTVRSSFFANFQILDDTMVWSVTDKGGGNVFAMGNFNIPEPGSLLLLVSGMLGLMLVVFYKPRVKQKLVS